MHEMLDLITAMLPATPVAPPPDLAPAAPSPMEVQSVWDFVVKGGLMMIPIGLCSLVALTVTIERGLSLRRRRVIPDGFMAGLRDALGDDVDRRAGLAYCERDGSPVAVVVAAGLRRRGSPIEVVERHIQETGLREALKLRRRLRVLSVIAAVAPLMGLLGTIFGMIRAFQTVATSGEALGKTELLAEGIYEAMITTAAGLLVAIPALICFHWLASRVQRLVMDIDQTSVEFIEACVWGACDDALPIASATAEAAPVRPAATAAAAAPAALDGADVQVAT